METDIATRKVLFEKIYQDIDVQKVQQQIFKEFICRGYHKIRFEIYKVERGKAHYSIDFYYYRQIHKTACALNYWINIRDIKSRPRTIFKKIERDVHAYFYAVIAKRELIASLRGGRIW